MEQESADAERGEREIDADVDGVFNGQGGVGGDYGDGKRRRGDGDQADHGTGGAGVGLQLWPGSSLLSVVHSNTG